MTFGYDKESSYRGMIDIEDVGNFALEAIDDNYNAYYMIVFTKFGKTTIMTYYPIAVDNRATTDNLNCTLCKVDFNDKYMKCAITKFLSDFKGKHITQVNLLDYDKAFELLDNPVELFKSELDKEN